MTTFPSQYIGGHHLGLKFYSVLLLLFGHAKYALRGVWNDFAVLSKIFRPREHATPHAFLMDLNLFTGPIRMYDFGTLCVQFSLSRRTLSGVRIHW